MPKMTTPACLHCDKTSTVELTDDEYHRMYRQSMLIQHALPDRDAGFRELMMTGTHPKCWEEIFADEDAES